MRKLELVNEAMLEELKKEGRYLLYFKTASCSVCDVMEDKLSEEFKDIDLTMGLIQIEKMTRLRGQYLVFTGPTLIVFDGEKEIHRESRFIDTLRLRKLFNLWLS